MSLLLLALKTVLFVLAAWSLLTAYYIVGTDLKQLRQRSLEDADRGRVQYADTVMAFATLIAFIAVAPWVYTANGMAASSVDPLTATLLRIALPMFVIAMIISIGVSARQG